jgi:glycosyltransferase involved in cell wall biosynthesis
VQKTGVLPLKKRPELNFKFMVVGGPAEAYIERCLESIKNQNYPNWTAQVVLDPVGDETYNKALKFQSDKIKIKLNDSRNYNVANFLEAAKLLNPGDNDIMIMVDADDWLANPYVLSVVKKYYNDDPELLVTHGSWAPYPKPNIHNNNPYSEEEFKQGIRKFQWRGSHLKTFRFKLWRHIREEDLRDDTGNLFSVTGDLALMFPLLEMAGYHRVKFISDVLYIYNQETSFSDDKKNLQRQMWLTDWLASKKPYECLEKF